MGCFGKTYMDEVMKETTDDDRKKMICKITEIVLDTWHKIYKDVKRVVNEKAIGLRDDRRVQDPE